ncbi:hypothetical protein SAMN05444392_103128 [Seinonella peptonophila]|uniref:Nucleotidase n=1 Tax=Seinonella peptonophila TaxID=112248 RepID=A0A1M4WAQ7_9BACL|nr:HAD family hydrolase [Seinonella peptonophila]SHE78306.1 hypothetical protein SAMN05444392_103128 [Seinonella peptonophila]
MSVLRLGVDIDGTIVDTHRIAVELFNKKLDKNVRAEEVVEFYLDQAYEMTPSEGKVMWRQLEGQIYEQGKPFPDAAEVLNQLQEKGHQIYYVTARPSLPEVKKVTKWWLQHYHFPYHDHRLIMDARNKSKVATKLQLDLCFEDAPDHLERYDRDGIPAVIIDATYNRDLPYQMDRIRNWNQVPSIINKMMG